MVSMSSYHTDFLNDHPALLPQTGHRLAVHCGDHGDSDTYIVMVDIPQDTLVDVLTLVKRTRDDVMYLHGETVKEDLMRTLDPGDRWRSLVRGPASRETVGFVMRMPEWRLAHCGYVAALAVVFVKTSSEVAF